MKEDQFCSAVYESTPIDGDTLKIVANKGTPFKLLIVGAGPKISG
jgi:hypothetical protein